MYRISFDPKTGRFIIQILRFGLFWVNVQREIPGPDGPVTINDTFSFQTYDAARKHVEATGLDQLYQDRSENIRRNFLLT